MAALLLRTAARRVARVQRPRLFSSSSSASSSSTRAAFTAKALRPLVQFTAAAGTLLAAAQLSLNADEVAPTAAAAADGPSGNEKIFTRAEIAKHDNADAGYWVTYKDDVFDVTDFIEQHPGGNRILLAVGGPIDGYWSLYKQHKTDAVFEILMQYKIGKLDPNDVQEVDETDPYSTDPERSPMLRVHTTAPFNAETVTQLIPDHFLTPNEMWYVRHHHPVPSLNEAEFQLEVESNNGKTIKLSIEDLKTMFPKAETTITLQCAGNRRQKYDEFGKTQGLKWDVGAISTAVWGGVWLSDVLRAIGYDKETAKHVQFTGEDAPFDASIPFHKAISEYGDVLLAWEMNGEPIPREHGAPLRVMVPGHLAARSVKWLNKVRISDEEAYSTWVRGFAYKSMGHSNTFEGVDAEKLPSVQELPVQSAICVTEDQIEADETETVVSGYAYSGGGRGIIRVSVSADDGETWTEAQLKEGSDQELHRAWAWTLWEATVPLQEEKGDKVRFCVKAVDASCNQQPRSCKDLWNLRGILNNAWHFVEVPVVKPTSHDHDE